MCDHRLVVTRAVIETDTEGVITRWDPGAETLLGYAAQNAVGHPVDLIIPEHLRARLTRQAFGAPCKSRA